MASLKIDEDCRTWTQVRNWIENACTECDGWWSVEALEQLLCNGRAVLWVLEEDQSPVAAVVTAIANWEGRKVAEIIAAGGSGVIDALQDELPKVEEWARAHGADEIMFRGRRGWARLYKALGYQEIAVTMRKAV